MSLVGVFRRRKTVVLLILAILVITAVTYGVVTYQTPYGCANSNGNIVLPDKLPNGSGVDLQVLSEPCFYVYFTGIVGGSVLLILLISVAQKEAKVPSASSSSVRPTG